MDPVLLSVLSSVGVQHHAHGFANVHVKTVEDLSALTDADLMLAGLQSSEVADLRVSLDTILKGKRLRQQDRIARAEAEAARRRGDRPTCRQRAHMCTYRLLPCVRMCMQAPKHHLLLHEAPAW